MNVFELKLLWNRLTLNKLFCVAYYLIIKISKTRDIPFNIIKIKLQNSYDISNVKRYVYPLQRLNKWMDRCSPESTQ